MQDVAVAGGGPAGLAAALLLAREGLRVTVVTLPAGRPRIEGASPRVTALLARLGVEAASALPLRPRRCRWGSLDGTFNRESIVDRRLLDLQLRRAAETAGVRIVAGRAGRLRDGAVESATGVIRAPLLIEARGCRAPSQRARLRGPASIAIAGVSGPDLTCSEIEARPAGWIWRAPGRWVQAVTDAATVAERGVAGAWAAVADAAWPLPQRPVVSAAELRLSAPELPPGVLVLGDAAVAMDPLSGHGLFWALSSAFAAPAMVRAILDGEAELVRRFHRERVVATFWRQARIGRDFYRMAGIDGRFWRARAAWPDAAPAHAAAEGWRLERRVVVAGGRLAEREVLLTAEEPDGVAFIAGHPVAEILARLGNGPLPPAAEFGARVVPEAPPETAETIHGWLASRIAGRSEPRKMETSR